LHTIVLLRRAREDLRRRGVPWRSLELSVDTNAVVVGVQGDVDEYGQLLRQEFGPTVVVKQSFGARGL
jgi:hypothetical protein